jgi:hypothetical protein
MVFPLFLSDNEFVSSSIPDHLKEVNQLNEYFEDKRTIFSFKMNPKELTFNKKYGSLY